MQTVTLKFDVSGQNLIAGDLTRYASNTVNYVKAVFDLDGNWNSFDSVRAVWSTDFECISTVLDSEGVCYVPQEVLKRTGNVMVNLVGSIAENDELTDRLTTYPVVALVINANAKVCGTETAEVTPSQFEQYVAMVVAEVEKVTGMTATAVALPEGSAPTAVYENGVLTLGIPKGDKGETGNGISSVEFNADYSLTFNFTESEPYTTPSIRGERGAQGYGIVSVEKIGTAGLVDTYQVNYEDSSVPPTTFTVTNGAKGDTGNGISSVTKTGTVGLVDTYRITFTNGGHYDFNVTNGAKGDTGATGNGIATIAKTSTSGLVDTYTITFTDGTSTTFEVTNGQDGEVTYDELSELLPTETASGDIASFNDGQAVIPAVSVVATITPIQSGSGTPSPSNVRPISGHDEVEVGVVGKNLFDKANTIELYCDGSTKLVSNATFKSVYVPLLPNTQYVYSQTVFGNYTRLAVCNSLDAGTNIYSPISKASGYETTTPLAFTNTDYKYLVCTIYRSTTDTHTFDEIADSCMLELGSTATTYEPYNGTTYTDTLPSTTYGGTLDLVSGLLTVDKIVSDMGTLEWYKINGNNYANFYTTAISDLLYSASTINIMCSAYKAEANNTALASADGYVWTNVEKRVRVKDTSKASMTAEQFATSVSGQTLVYTLATPTTYQLTPQQIDTLKGQNNITATSGQVSVTYKADIQKYIDNAIATFA